MLPIRVHHASEVTAITYLAYIEGVSNWVRLRFCTCCDSILSLPKDGVVSLFYVTERQLMEVVCL